MSVQVQPSKETLPLVRALSTIRRADAQLWGSKAACIGELSWRGYSVPPFLVLPVEVYETVIVHCRLKEFVLQLSRESAVAKPARLLAIESEIAEAFEQAEMPEQIQEQTQAWIAAHGDTFAVRSSALYEDLLGSSFAGLYNSFLDVRPEHISRAVLRCYASLFTARAALYRRRKQLAEPGEMAVIIQEMVRGVHGGVVWTRNPRNPETLLIECAGGGADPVVSGQVSPGRFTVNRETLQVEEARDYDGISRAGICAVAREAMAIEAEFGGPQDIEYVMANNTVYILQARPAKAGTYTR